ncbi:MAG TPA: GDYXXLXY domain-containing protein [Chryseosolibacter sp.]|nr:GDYXXLXY domain-containing protein [Chryseosolibacter sp.]
MKKYTFLFFGLMCIGQWFVPGKMIADNESTLANGKLFRFKSAPVDPTDPFRGSYIVLSFDITAINQKKGEQWKSGDHVFVSIGNDSAGFAAVKEASLTRPSTTSHYVEVALTHNRYRDHEGVFRIEWPFDRFYMEESKAPAAERIYDSRAREDSTQVAYAEVRVKDGTAVIEDVKINDRSVVDIVRENNKK